MHRCSFVAQHDARRDPVVDHWLRLGTVDKPREIVSDCDDIARQALDNIANGPVVVPPHMESAFRTISSLPRGQAAETMRDILLGGITIGRDI